MEIDEIMNWRFISTSNIQFEFLPWTLCWALVVGCSVKDQVSRRPFG